MKKAITFIMILIASVTTMLCVGCAPTVDPPPVNYEVVISTPSLSMQKTDVIDVADNLSVTNMTDATFTLTSSDTNVAVVDGTQITAIGVGSTTITVSAQTPNGIKSSTFAVTVNLRTFTVTFKNEDGSVISSSMVQEGSPIILPMTNPTKPSTAQYNYTFADWTGYTSGMTVDGNKEFTATFSESVRKYTVTFKNEFGAIISTSQVDYGSTVSAPLDTPTKDSDVQYDYSFDKWLLNGEEYDFLTPITEDIQLVASFSNSVKSYVVTFLDNDGNVFETATLEYGSVIVAPQTTPTPPPSSDPNVGWFFRRWRNSTTNAVLTQSTIVTGNVTFKPQFMTEELITTFTGFVLDENGNKINAKVYVDGVEYGEATALDGYKIENLHYGEYAVKFVNDNYLEKQVKFVSERNANNNVDVTLNKPLFVYGEDNTFGYDADAEQQHKSETYTYSEFATDYVFAPENLVLSATSVVKFSVKFEEGCSFTNAGNFTYNEEEAKLNLVFTVQGGVQGANGFVNKNYGMGFNNQGDLYTELGTPASSDGADIAYIGGLLYNKNYEDKIYIAYVRQNENVWMYAKMYDDDYKLIASLSDDFPASSSRQIKLAFSQGGLGKFKLAFTLSDFEIITDEEIVSQYASRRIQIEYDEEKVEISHDGIAYPGKAMGNEKTMTVYARAKSGYYITGVFDEQGNSVATPTGGAFSITVDLCVIRDYGPYYVRVEELSGEFFSVKGNIVAEDGNNEGILVTMGTSATFTNANGDYELSIPTGISFEGLSISFEKEGYYTYVKPISYTFKQKLENATKDVVVENSDNYKQLQRIMIRPEGVGPYTNSSGNTVSYDYEKGSEKIDVTSAPRKNIFFSDVYAKYIMLKTRFTIEFTTDPDPRVGVRFMNSENKGIRVFLWQEGFDTKLDSGWNSENGTYSQNSIAGSGVNLTKTGVTYDMIIVKKGNVVEVYAKHFMENEYLFVGRENTVICKDEVYISLEHNCINEYRLIAFEDIEIYYGNNQECLPEEYR